MYEMNPKILKLRSEQAKDAARLEMLQNRMHNRSEQITALENTDIVGAVRDRGLTVEQLFEMLRELRENVVPHPEAEPYCDN